METDLLIQQIEKNAISQINELKKNDRKRKKLVFLRWLVEDGVPTAEIVRKLYLAKKTLYNIWKWGLDNGLVENPSPYKMAKDTNILKIHILESLGFTEHDIVKGLGIGWKTLKRRKTESPHFSPVYMEFFANNDVLLENDFLLKRQEPFLVRFTRNDFAEIIFPNTLKTYAKPQELIGKITLADAYPVFRSILKSDMNPWWVCGQPASYDFSLLLAERD